MGKPHKIHLASTNPPLTSSGPSGSLVETMCNRHCLENLVASQERYSDWEASGLAIEVFCGKCLAEL